ncbi:hypothetical protein D3C84_949710 [compost metagenome]
MRVPGQYHYKQQADRHHDQVVAEEAVHRLLRAEDDSDAGHRQDEVANVKQYRGNG